MKEYSRRYPIFSLCGLNCGLCPRFQTEGSSKCPGCGGKDFHLKHPTCAVITCSRKHGNFEFCFECQAYPCRKYSHESDKDSFITYKNVNTDLEKAKSVGVETYVQMLERKVSILETLIRDFNDGRSKGFYCLAVSLLKLEVLDEIMSLVQNIPDESRVKSVVELMLSKARDGGIELHLRK